MTALLEAEDLVYRVNGKSLVDGVSVRIEPGELMGLVGPNGAGKSTLVRLLAGDLEPAAGSVAAGSIPIASMTPLELAKVRAVLPPKTILQFAFTVEEVVAMGRYPHRLLASNTREADEAAIAGAMRRMDVAHLATRSFPTLSDGEQTRVSLARVLAQDTPIVFLDEPTSSLDVHHQETVMQTLVHLAAGGAAVLSVLHDLNLAARYASRIGVMSEGRLAALGPAEEVLQAPLLTEVYRQPMTVIPHPHRDCPLVLMLDPA